MAQYYDNEAPNVSSAVDERYNPTSDVYGWWSSTVGFRLTQSVPGHGAFDFAPFQIGDTHFLALASSYDGATFDVDSTVLRWDGSTFVPLQSIPTHDAVDMEPFQVGPAFFLAVANAASGDRTTSTFLVDSAIYCWNGSTFDLFTTVPTKGAYDFEYFTIGGAPYLAVANSGDGTTSHVDSVVYALR